MRVGFIATALQAAVMQERDAIEGAYERYPEAVQSWCLVDLVGSSNYRIVRGPREGYVRGETFFSLVRAVVAPCPDVRPLKELGDAVLLCSPSPRPLFECLLLIDQVVYQMASIVGSEYYPFAVRGALSFGSAKRIVRREEDYLGKPLDRLARLLSVRSDSSNLLLDESAFKVCAEWIDEYADFLSTSKSKPLTPPAGKQLAENVSYRELKVDRERLLEFKELFHCWQQNASPSQPA